MTKGSLKVLIPQFPPLNVDMEDVQKDQRVFFFFLRFIFSVCGGGGGGVHAPEGSQGGQKEASDPLELDLQVMNCLIWVLGTEFRCSEKQGRTQLLSLLSSLRTKFCTSPDGHSEIKHLVSPSS